MQGKGPSQADCNQKPVGYSECGPRTSVVILTQELPSSTESQPHPEFLNQNRHFYKIAGDWKHIRV